MEKAGIFAKAKEAKEKHAMESAREKLILALHEYQLAMKKETLESIITNIDGFESILPDDDGGYTVVIDGFVFYIDENLNIEYRGEDNGIVPEVEVQQEVKDGQVTVKVKAKTEDEEGIKEIRLLKDKNIEETKKLNGEKEKEEIFNVSKNGIYKVVVVGKNGKQKISEEIKVTEFSNIVASITAGTVTNGQTDLTITVEVLEGQVNKIELYNGETKIEEKTYATAEKNIEEVITVNIPFYEESNYYAKVIDSANKEEATETIALKNEEYIRTEADLKKLAEKVNDGTTTFQNKTIKQGAEITLQAAHIAIGTPDAPFKGTYDGQEYSINNIQISNTLQHQGLFGYIENATIKNVTLGTGRVYAGNTIGGLVGEANGSTIENVKNNGTTVIGRNLIEDTWEYQYFYTGEILTWTGDASKIGGIVGRTNDTNITKCVNGSAIQGYSYGAYVGGIVGEFIGNKKSLITECTNSGSMTKGSLMAGIVGGAVGNVSIESCLNTGDINASTTNIAGISGDGLYENGNIKNCTNMGNITGDCYVGGIVATAGSKNSKLVIDNCKNKGAITSTGYENFELYDNGWVDASHIGGIAGSVMSTNITNSSNEGSIISSSNVDVFCIGGIAGTYKDGTIENCFNTKDIKNTKMNVIGGIVGVGYWSTITKCYNKAQITGNTAVAGIVGTCTDAITLTYNYNTGDITGNDTVAGILGDGSPPAGNPNYIYYCYNTGKITANDVYYGYGGIAGCIYSYSIYHTYSLENTCESNIGSITDCDEKGYDLISNSNVIKQNILSNFGSNFKADYTDNAINGGYPILSWQ